MPLSAAPAAPKTLSSRVLAMILDSTYGVAFVGLIVESTIFGVTLFQTYEYYRHYPDDPKALKALVAFLTLLDTLHVILCARTIYWYLITNFTNSANLEELTWSMALQTDCNGLIGAIVQVFFARRLWLMSRNWFLASFIVVLGVVYFGLGVVFTVRSFALEKFTRFGSLTWITVIGLGSAAAADILIAVSMCYYLTRKRTGMIRTDSVVMTLMVYSINTGLLTSILASAALILFVVQPTNFVWLSFFWILGKCYVNSFLAILNSREKLRTKVFAPTAIELIRAGRQRLEEAEGNPHLTVTGSNSLTRKPSAIMAVSIQTTTEYKSDFNNPEMDLADADLQLLPHSPDFARKGVQGLV